MRIQLRDRAHCERRVALDEAISLAVETESLHDVALTAANCPDNRIIHAAPERPIVVRELEHAPADWVFLLALGKASGPGGPRVTKRIYPDIEPVTPETLDKLIANIQLVITHVESLHTNALAARAALQKKASP